MVVFLLHCLHVWFFDFKATQPRYGPASEQGKKAGKPLAGKYTGILWALVGTFEQHFAVAALQFKEESLCPLQVQWGQPSNKLERLSSKC